MLIIALAAGIGLLVYGWGRLSQMRRDDRLRRQMWEEIDRELSDPVVKPEPPYRHDPLYGPKIGPPIQVIHPGAVVTTSDLDVALMYHLEYRPDNR